mmetsp:Transcript_40353/g.52882  ORF Transcript_40353/g.52882 Transcript_40353/m.52882 type:complete len:87 (+) Transcript_40353:418-678(+)
MAYTCRVSHDADCTAGLLRATKGEVGLGPAARVQSLLLPQLLVTTDLLSRLVESVVLPNCLFARENKLLIEVWFFAQIGVLTLPVR